MDEVSIHTISEQNIQQNIQRYFQQGIHTSYITQTFSACTSKITIVIVIIVIMIIIVVFSGVKCSERKEGEEREDCDGEVFIGGWRGRGRGMGDREGRKGWMRWIWWVRG